MRNRIENVVATFGLTFAILGMWIIGKIIDKLEAEHYETET